MLTRTDSCTVIERIAATLGVRRDTRRKWRARGKVPARWHLPILDRAKAEALELDPGALSDYRPGPAPTVPFLRSHHARIEAGGRVTLPEPVLRELDLKVGDPVVLKTAGGELRLRSLKRAIADVQALVRQYVPADVSLVDELIAERREAAELE
jgi:bifunctional DNA-binding transcriptional regulator/antitoxin component of YhaV-PrlF toxin-antitoxin module